ncbi:MAG: hypothetical protein SOW48_07340 [Peptoniphilaceae bacterium]|nr:hypothetical protein [Peptoniphilaceae bacterium]MDD7434779.1 hypothetical protein [Peptoniphilaceae bacterium]MDY3076444.1 hypothetical protein [Peptoniphilaceae bacterium]MDY4196803.1 hypothetical protein [Peptoniphilaceae bacterium]
MGLFTVSKDEVQKSVQQRFGDTESYLIALKHNTEKSGFLKLMISTLWAVTDGSREFILVFSEKGIYENEISLENHQDYVLIPWHEVTNFGLDERGKEAVLSVSHLGKRYGYVIPFTGSLMRENKERYENLKQADWNRSAD